MLRVGFTLLLIFGLATAAEAQDRPEQIRLTLSPAPEPNPALVHSLWLSARERQPGNGATFYYRAMLMAQANRAHVNQAFPEEKTSEWINLPLADLPADDVARYVEMHKNVLNELKTATTRETCQWNLQIDQLRGAEVISFHLHDFQQLRELSRMVAYKARYEVAEGRYQDALGTLRMGYQMAYDAAEPPLLINALVGMAIAAQMNVATLDLIDAPDSPNLYWALKQLPHPLVDVRPSLAFEMAIPFRMFPYLQDAETAQRTPAEWQRLAHETIADLNALEGEHRLADWQLRLGATAMMMKAYPIAKEALIASGKEPEAVEQMPVAQVVAIHAARNYRYTYDEVYKWSLLPFPEAHARMHASLAKLKSDGYIGQPFSDKEVLPLASVLMPSIESVMVSAARSDRRLAALETIEALRMHAAAKGGELPSSLEHLAIAPAAKNPVTGQHFDYRREEGRAVLEERFPGFDAPQAHDRVYLIELAKPGK